jgi:hypothetical protein
MNKHIEFDPVCTVLHTCAGLHVCTHSTLQGEEGRMGGVDGRSDVCTWVGFRRGGGGVAFFQFIYRLCFIKGFNNGLKPVQNPFLKQAMYMHRTPAIPPHPHLNPTHGQTPLRPSTPDILLLSQPGNTHIGADRVCKLMYTCVGLHVGNIVNCSGRMRGLTRRIGFVVEDP